MFAGLPKSAQVPGILCDTLAGTAPAEMPLSLTDDHRMANLIILGQPGRCGRLIERIDACNFPTKPADRPFCATGGFGRANITKLHAARRNHTLTGSASPARTRDFTAGFGSSRLVFRRTWPMGNIFNPLRLHDYRGFGFHGVYRNKGWRGQGTASESCVDGGGRSG